MVKDTIGKTHRSSLLCVVYVYRQDSSGVVVGGDSGRDLEKKKKFSRQHEIGPVRSMTVDLNGISKIRCTERKL